MRSKSGIQSERLMLAMNKLMQNLQPYNVMNKLMCFFLIYLLAAATFSGFFMKWGFRDGDGDRLSFQSILQGTAARPFVYRRLLPDVAVSFKNVLPQEAKNKFAARITGKNSIISRFYPRAIIKKDFAAEYYIVYILCRASWFFALLMLARLVFKETSSEGASYLATGAFALFFPLLETVGGYYYDMPEVLFFALAVYFAQRGWWQALLLLAPVAELNKEAFFWFIPTLYPFMRQKLSAPKTILALGASILLAGLAYLYVRSLYSQNVGGTVELWFMRRILDEFNVSSYFRTEYNYGVQTGAGMFLPHVIFVVYLVGKAWNRLSVAWQQHALIAAAINLPLYVLFCCLGELRNLSMLYLSFVIIIGVYLNAEFIRKRPVPPT